MSEVRLSKIDEARKACEDFVRLVKDCFPEQQRKVKIHLILHLTESMIDFGPTSTFNTVVYHSFYGMVFCICCVIYRCETYNSLIRARNIYANRLAPSRDIAHAFATLGHLRFICSGGSLDGSLLYISVQFDTLIYVIMFSYIGVVKIFVHYIK